MDGGLPKPLPQSTGRPRQVAQRMACSEHTAPVHKAVLCAHTAQTRAGVRAITNIVSHNPSIYSTYGCICKITLQMFLYSIEHEYNRQSFLVSETLIWTSLSGHAHIALIFWIPTVNQVTWLEFWNNYYPNQYLQTLWFFTHSCPITKHIVNFHSCLFKTFNTLASEGNWKC